MSWMNLNNSSNKPCIISNYNKFKKPVLIKLMNLKKYTEKLIKATKISQQKDQVLSALSWTNSRLRSPRHFLYMIRARKMNWYKWPRKSAKRKLQNNGKSKTKRNKNSKLWLLNRPRKRVESHRLPNRKIPRKLKLRWRKERKLSCNKLVSGPSKKLQLLQDQSG